MFLIKIERKYESPILERDIITTCPAGKTRLSLSDGDVYRKLIKVGTIHCLKYCEMMVRYDVDSQVLQCSYDGDIVTEADRLCSSNDYIKSVW